MQVGDTIVEGNLSGKVITEINDTLHHKGLPIHSNTSSIYFKLAKKENASDNNFIEQMRVYKDRKAYLDFDWNHDHGSYKKGKVHVHDWIIDKNGVPRRTPPRIISEEEVNRYGKILKKVFPNIKLK